jgi:8-oxo-dGTP pyrophosphatase MutT (NUDIX family)
MAPFDYPSIPKWPFCYTDAMISPKRQHPIQRSILEDLRTSSTGLRYAEMKPSDIENDLYNYHLQYLAKNEMVVKRDEKYYLSTAGKEYLVDLNPLDATGESARFKLAAAMLVIRGQGADTQLLYQNRLRQPFAGVRGLIGGGIMRGEPAAQAARRRLEQEAGLIADFRLLGMLRKIRFDEDGKLYSDILFHVCVSEEYEGVLETQNSFGLNFWVPLAEAIRIETMEVVGSKQLAAILRQLEFKSLGEIPHFYIEEIYRHDIY